MAGDIPDDERQNGAMCGLILTARQLCVIDRLARGERAAQIAYAMDLKPETVNAHILRIRKKFGAKTNAHAVALWLGYRTPWTEKA